MNEATEDGTNYVYINLVLVSFSVQFNYTDADTDEITACNDFATNGIYNSTNYN